MWAKKACLQIDAKRSVPQEQKPKSKKIFVGGLAPDTMEGMCCHSSSYAAWLAEPTHRSCSLQASSGRTLNSMAKLRMPR